MAVNLTVSKINRMDGMFYADSPTGTAGYITHENYGRMMASACFYSFFANYRGLNHETNINFDWGQYSGTFESQLYQLYGTAATKTTPWVTPEPTSAAPTDITIKTLVNPTSGKFAVTITGTSTITGMTTSGCYKYGSALTETIFNKFFSLKKSPLQPKYNKQNVTVGMIFSAFSSSLLTIMDGKIYNDITDSSYVAVKLSGYVGYADDRVYESINLNDYIRSAATWTYNTFLGPNYIWHGGSTSPYQTTNSAYRSHYTNGIDYKFSGNSSQNNVWSSGWIGTIRTSFHAAMKSLIDSQT